MKHTLAMKCSSQKTKIPWATLYDWLKQTPLLQKDMSSSNNDNKNEGTDTDSNNNSDDGHSNNDEKDALNEVLPVDIA